MKKIKTFFLISTFLVLSVTYAQRKNLNGKLIADDEVEGLHILNRTGAKYTISNEDGSFVIPAKALDTLVISGVKYQKQEFVITPLIMELGQFNVQLIENINELNEVVIGKILTGSLESDIENSDTKTEIDFYDLGIPGYTVKPLTQNERKLHDADAGPIGYIGFGGGVNLHKLLNTISGRTKKLKAIVALDGIDNCIERSRRDYEAFLFEKDSLTRNLRNEYFLFCQGDDEFLILCNENNDIKLLEFLQDKLKVYKDNRKLVSKD